MGIVLITVHHPKLKRGYHTGREGWIRAMAPVARAGGLEGLPPGTGGSCQLDLMLIWGKQLQDFVPPGEEQVAPMAALRQ